MRYIIQGYKYINNSFEFDYEILLAIFEILNNKAFSDYSYRDIINYCLEKLARERGYEKWLYWKDYKNYEDRIKIHFEIILSSKYGLVIQSRSVKTAGKSVAMYSINQKNILKFKNFLKA